MLGAAEYLDLTNPEHKLGFALFASARAADYIAALRGLHVWELVSELPYTPSHLFSWQWDENISAIGDLVGASQGNLALAIWIDVFDCAWESARSDDEHGEAHDDS